MFSAVSAVSLVASTGWCDEPNDTRSSTPSAQVRSNCSLRFFGGLERGTAQTATNIVCDELRAAGGTGNYVVDLEKLDAKVILRVSDEGTGGQALDSRRVILASLDEVPNAAPRVARALVENKPVADTANVSNLLGEETTKAKKKSGDFLWGVGLVGLMMPTNSTSISTGAEFPFLYEANDFAVGGSFKFAVNGRDEGSSQVALSVGGRQFMQPTNTSLFWGAGMSVEWLSLSTTSRMGGYDSSKTYTGNGAALYGELGVETMRFHRSRLLAAVRVDAPLFTTTHDTYNDATTSTKYALPLSFNVTYLW